MRNDRFENMLKSLSLIYHKSPEQIRRDMQIAMESGMSSPDPQIQARWAKIPRKGDTLTLEEFVDYISHQINKGC